MPERPSRRTSAGVLGSGLLELYVWSLAALIAALGTVAALVR